MLTFQKRLVRYCLHSDWLAVGLLLSYVLP